MSKDTLADKVHAKIDEMRPYLERTGGTLEFVDVEDGIAHVRFALTRPRSSRLVVSLQMVAGIERRLRGELPELRGVEAVNLPPYTELGWDQPSFAPVDMPAPDDAPAPRPERS